MSSVLAAANPAISSDKPIRVMVVDDAIVVRSLLARWIEAEPDMTVTGTSRTGREAIDELERYDPDVVVLDVDMPVLDGIAALPELLRKKRDLVVIMASTLTRRGAETSLKALSLGAADYVPKPQAAPDAAASSSFHRELIDKIRHLGRRGRTVARQRTPAAAPDQLAPAARPRPDALLPQAEAVALSLRPFALTSPRVLLVGCSTGGPQALTFLAGSFGKALERIPILITQHMPPTFTTVLAEHLTRASGRCVHEAKHGEAVVPGGIYVAPGGRHMRVARGTDGPTIALGNDPAINFCKPSVDPLFASAAEIWGPASLALVLTGMGSDGTRGATAIVAAGGSVIAQDEATSVIWGMPRSVAQAGLCAAVLPLDQIAAKIARLVSGDRS
jgi:two-component system chemotaxis response regulator CheB